MIEPYQQTQTESSPFMSPMQMYGSNMLQLTNPESELYKMELALRSMMLDKDGNPVKVGTPLMNDEGISSVMSQVQAIVNQVTIMSNFDKKDIQILMEFLSDTLAKDLMMKRKAYGMTYTTRDKVFFIALSYSLYP